MATRTKIKQTTPTAVPKTEHRLNLPTQARPGPAVVKFHGDKLSEAFRR
jgi:hypothetical protein